MIVHAQCSVPDTVYMIQHILTLHDTLTPSTTSVALVDAGMPPATLMPWRWDPTLGPMTKTGTQT
jgi:hypothetical protein